MDSTMIFLLLVIAAAVLFFFLRRPKEKPMPYERRDLLTKTEHKFWVMLQREALEAELIVCPKVRMEDFIEVTDHTQTRQAWRNRIKSRHIDFVLCDSNLNMLAGVELDDQSHVYSQRTIESDEFKNAVFDKIGIPLYRIIVKEGNYVGQIREMIDDMEQRGLH